MKLLKYFSNKAVLCFAFVLFMLGISFVFHMTRTWGESTSYFLIYFAYLMLLDFLQKKGIFRPKRLSEHTIHEDLDFVEMYLRKKEYDHALRLVVFIREELKASNYYLIFKGDE